VSSIDQLSAALKLHEAIADAQKAIGKTAQAANDRFGEQVELAKQLRDVIGDISDRSGNLQSLSDALSDVGNTMDKTSDATKNTTGRLGELDKALKEGEKSSRGLSAGGTAVVGAFVGLGAAFKKTFSELGALGSLFGSVTRSILGVGSAIIALPFRLLGNLVKFAASGGGGMELRQAYEDVRKTFGDLATNEAKSVVESFQEMRSRAGDLGGTGLSLSRVFGVGPGGLAAALRAVNELAESLGARFSVLQDDIARAGGEIIAFQKGLGLTSEQMAALGTRAISEGRTFDDVLSETASLAIQMGDQFGVSAKLISRDMATMAADFENFGSLSQEELATTAVFARKLGLEVQDLQGVIGTFDNFESAAENASKLAQAFGVNIDAIQMLNAENPAERIDQLRESFFAAGKSIENMTRQERALLAQTTGLSGAALEAAFAQENMGLSYDQISAAAEDAADSPMSTAESMERLADSIERVFESGGGMDSFFGAFAEGFQQGLRWGGPFRELIRNIRRSLRETRRAGRSFARMIQRSFPGLIDIIGALADAFDPERFAGFFRDVESAAEKFFENMDPSNPSATIGAFFSDLRAAFTDNFGDGGDSILSRLGEGFQKALNFIGQVIVGAIPHIVDAMAGLLEALLAFLRTGEIPMADAASGMLGGLSGAFAEAFQGLGPVLQEAADTLLPLLKDVFVEMFKALLEEVGPLLGKLFAAMLLKNIVSAVVVGALKGGFAALATNFAGAMMAIPGFGGGGRGGPGGGGGGVDGTGGRGGLSGLISTLANLKKEQITKAAGNLIILGGAFAAALVLFVAGMAGAFLIARASGMFDDPTKFVMFMGVMASALIATALLVVASSSISGLAGALPALLLGLTTAAIVLTVGVVAFTAAVSLAWLAYKGTGMAENAAGVLGMFAVISAAVATLIGFAAAAVALTVIAALMIPMMVGIAATYLMLTEGVPMLVNGLGVSLNALRNLEAGPGDMAQFAAFSLVIGAVAVMMVALAGLGSLVMVSLGTFNFLANRGVKAVEKMMGKLGEDLFPAVGNMLSSMSNVNVEGVGAAVDAFGGIMEALQPLLDVATLAMNLSDNEDELDAMLTSVNDFITGVLDRVGPTMQRIVNSVRGMSLSEEARNVASTVVDIVGTFAQLYGAMNSSYATLEGGTEVIGGRYRRGENGERGELRRADREITRPQRLAIIDTIEDKIAGVQSLIELISNNRGLVRGIVSAVEQIGSANIDEAGIEKISAVTSLLGALPRIMQGLEITEEAEDAGFFGSTTQSITRQMNPAEMRARMQTMVSALEVLAEFSPDIGRQINAIDDGLVLGDDGAERIATVVETYGKVAQGIADVYNAFASIGDIDISRQMDLIGSRFGIENGTVTVEAEAVNVTVNLNVTMDANRVAEVLANSQVVTNGRALATQSSVAPN
jgi:hypothetical protein